MRTTYNFEELDTNTRDYLIAVRDDKAHGTPGVFVSTTDTLPKIGCLLGPVIIIVTILWTFLSSSMILNDPTGLAMLQTAGLMVGLWLTTAKMRLSIARRRLAGNWIYADPLFLYVAYREQVTLTSLEELNEARVSHHYNNNTYTNSTLFILFSGNNSLKVTIPNENKADQFVSYLNYIAWSRSTEGEARAKLSPAILGGLARYVALKDEEPKDAEGELDLNLLELDLTDIPEQPSRDGRVAPSVLPYIVMVLVAGLIFSLFAFVIDPPMRDDMMFNLIMKYPEPQYLRLYLSDSRNTRHRDAVAKRLSQFYDDPIRHVRQNGGDPALREGMAKLLESLRTAEQPVVSLRVIEQGVLPGQGDGKANREKILGTQLVNAINREFSRQSWGKEIRVPNETNPPPRSPIGEQLVAFIVAPDGAKVAHLDITYAVEPANKGQSRLVANVTIRTSIDEAPVATGTVALAGTFAATDIGTQIPQLASVLARSLVGPLPEKPPGNVVPPGKF